MAATAATRNDAEAYKTACSRVFSSGTAGVRERVCVYCSTCALSGTHYYVSGKCQRHTLIARMRVPIFEASEGCGNFHRKERDMHEVFNSIDK